MSNEQKLREALQAALPFLEDMQSCDECKQCYKVGKLSAVVSRARQALALPTAAPDAQHRALKGIPCPTCSGRGDLGLPLERAPAPVGERERFESGLPEHASTALDEQGQYKDWFTRGAWWQQARAAMARGGE